MNMRLLLACGALLLTAGCANMPRLVADVQSYAQWPTVPTAITYKFERTPSQNSGQAAEVQARLEAATKPVLAQLNWQESKEPGAAATHSVGLNWRVVKVEDPHHPWYGLSPSFGWRDYVVTRNGHVVWLPVGPRLDWPTTKRELQITVRDLKTQNIVFESTAKHESRSGADAEIVALLAQAALDGFPTPAPGARVVRR